MKYEIGLKLFLLFTSGAQNIWCITHSVYYKIYGKRNMNNFIQDRKYVDYLSIRALLKIISRSFTLDIRTEYLVFLKGVWPSNKFERFVVFSTNRLKGVVNFFIREFLKVFYFPSDFIVVVENF